jgi:hypothetical protein
MDDQFFRAVLALAVMGIVIEHGFAVAEYLRRVTAGDSEYQSSLSVWESEGGSYV